jgi:hypothetical protein
MQAQTFNSKLGRVAAAVSACQEEAARGSHWDRNELSGLQRTIIRLLTPEKGRKKRRSDQGSAQQAQHAVSHHRQPMARLIPSIYLFVLANNICNHRTKEEFQEACRRRADSLAVVSM